MPPTWKLCWIFWEIVHIIVIHGAITLFPGRWFNHMAISAVCNRVNMSFILEIHQAGLIWDLYHFSLKRKTLLFYFFFFHYREARTDYKSLLKTIIIYKITLYFLLKIRHENTWANVSLKSCCIYKTLLNWKYWIHSFELISLI